ncbi:MAG: precorrin-2 C(20)-methyltransferase [Synergistaceae bacterium]|nr:precorrin-2 C(20)-methyltransferase [Synergistaceae bacterium]
MKFTVAGVGPGDPELVTIKAIKIIKDADLVLAPYSPHGKFSVSEQIVRSNLPDIDIVPIVFPMLTDPKEREKFLINELERIFASWHGVENVVLPVIGDSVLYATGSYLFDAWRKLVPDLELSLVPGISSHQFASSRLSSFLAMGDDLFSVIPCSKNSDGIIAALKRSDSAALYKPSILKGRLSDVVSAAGPWGRIVRVDRAGLADEKIYEGNEALEQADEYLSILLLRRSK